MKLADRVSEDTTTTGTGSYSLGGAQAGFRAFSSAFSTGDKVYYCCEDGTDWEVGIGTLTSGTPWTMARTTILASSNAGAAVNWGSGTKNLFCTAPAASHGGPAFYVRKSSNQTGAGVPLWNTIDLNNGSHYDAGTGVFTAPVAGIYLFNGGLLPVSTTNSQAFYFRKNGAQYGATTYAINADEVVAMSAIVMLAAGDTMDFYCALATGFEASYSYFAGAKIG